METLHHKLNHSITHLTELARTSKLISINVALLADQILHDRAGSSAGIKVVALEIQRLSDESREGLENLYLILDEIRLLTQTINLAGRQRMLSQKIMKIHLARRLDPAFYPADEAAKLTADFTRTLEQLGRCPLNNAVIRQCLARGTETWTAYLSAVNRDDLAASIRLNELVLQEMHATVQAYEELAGTKLAEAPGRRSAAA